MKEIVIDRYEQYLLGNRGFMLKSLSRKPGDKDDSYESPLDEDDARPQRGDTAERKSEKEESAKVIIRYAITDILGWTPEAAMDHLTWDILTQLKLSRLPAYLSFPRDIDPKEDLDYLVHMAFPNVRYDISRQVLRVYRRVLSGELRSFPKRLFSEGNGYEKAQILLRDVIENNLAAASPKDLYEFFADSAEANKFLSDRKIFDITKKIITTPLDYLHDSLPDDQKDDFLHAFYQFRNASNEVTKSNPALRIGERKKSRSASQNDIFMQGFTLYMSLVSGMPSTGVAG